MQMRNIFLLHNYDISDMSIFIYFLSKISFFLTTYVHLINQLKSYKLLLNTRHWTYRHLIIVLDKTCILKIKKKRKKKTFSYFSIFGVDLLAIHS